jgi:acyl-CoA synthetase (NDP forming)
MEILKAYGLEFPQSILVKSPKAAGEAVAELGSAVALKVQSPEILHKTEAGGVQLGIESPKEAEGAFQEILEKRPSIKRTLY